MSEKLNLRSPEDESSAQNISEEMDFPPFDLEKAQKLREQAEAEKKEISPEDLKDVNKMIDQLEQMGVKSEIANNPAFQRMLENRVYNSGLVASRWTEVKNGGDRLNISTACEKGDSRHHDRGNMNLIVSKNGSVMVEYATVDKDETMLAEDAFKGYNGQRTDDGYIPSNKINNIASITEFSLDNKGNLVTTEKSSMETQLIPQDDRGGEFGIYSGGRGEMTRIFDQNGDEQYREDVDYGYTELEGKDYLSPHLGKADYYTGTPNHASFNLLNTPQLLKNDVVRRTSYTRNPDGTMKVRDYNGSKSVEIEKASIRSEHGTADLIPVGPVLREALDEAYAKAEN